MRIYSFKRGKKYLRIMSTVATKYFCQINKGSIFFNTPCSISFARAFSSKLLKSECQIRTLHSLTSFSSSNLVSKMSGEFSHKRYCHYKAAVLKKLGEKLEIVELKRSTKLKDNQVLIKVHCCAVNVADTLICSGKYDHNPNLPFTPGYEFSGEILQVGPHVKDLHKGDKVIGLNKDNFSAMATECISESRDLWKIPQDVSFKSAAALVDSYATVLIAARRANLCEGDTVLVTVSAGGLGLAAVDLATNLFNAKGAGHWREISRSAHILDRSYPPASCQRGVYLICVKSKRSYPLSVDKIYEPVGTESSPTAAIFVIGACESEDKADVLREKGAFSTINYNKKKIVKTVLEETNNQGVKVVFDAVGGDVFEDCLQSISVEGCIVVLGFSSRKIPQILTSQLLPKSCALIGVSLTHYQKMINETYRSSVQEIIDMYLEKFIDPHVAEIFKLKDVNDAIKHVEERKSAGKVILSLD